MKKLLLILIPCSLFLTPCVAQNLVPNPSFEIYSTCPPSQCQIQDATGWSCYDQCVDYFNICAPPSNVGVPYTATGFQYAATGNAYIGEYFYFPNSGGLDREIAGTQLLAPLVKGTKYYVTFMVSLCSIDTIYGTNCAVNKLGAKFSTVSYTAISPPDTDNYAQVYTDSIVSDTLNWFTIRGSFIADSAYKYIMIGNFFNDAHTSKKYFFASVDTAAYYFIDDVCVSTDSLYTENWTGLDEIKSSSPSLVSVYPNPFTDATNIIAANSCSSPFSLLVYTPLGQVVRRIENIKTNTISFRKYDLSPGIYLYSLSNESGIISNGKLIIESK